jgi:hypothetical protein
VSTDEPANVPPSGVAAASPQTGAWSSIANAPSSTCRARPLSTYAIYHDRATTSSLWTSRTATARSASGRKIVVSAQSTTGATFGDLHVCQWNGRVRSSTCTSSPTRSRISCAVPLHRRRHVFPPLTSLHGASYATPDDAERAYSHAWMTTCCSSTPTQ